MEEFNIWDLNRVNIKINLNFLDKINKKIIMKFQTKRAAYNYIFKSEKIPFSSFKNLLKKSHAKRFFVPLDIYLDIIEILEISKENLQQNIISYKTAGGINYIENPILPIKITPMFDMLLAHHIADGTVIDPKKGRLPYFGYRQFNKFYRIQYVKKLEEVFGKIKYKEDYFEKSTRPYCPSVLSSLFFKYYKLDNKGFLSEKARIPKVIFDKGKESILSVLVAFIIDEGNIDSTQITIHLKNKFLIKDLCNICERLNYVYKFTDDSKNENNYFKLHILREGMEKLYEDYLLLHSLYPVVDLGWKGEKINKSFKIFNRKIFKSKGNKKLIYLKLKDEDLSVNQLADMINMTRQGVRFHIHNLLKEDKIKIINNKQLNWIYGI
ncbi:hypothetical protein COU53_00660 [Candidatus Pacearchaeota archaeon CG10_big_fil_rev_8_21_14_0_10_30_48]|nr:MAG: hypothetical protein COU53_00660 [Candidatus Pacearchaeota archaeon CG10_big_fil_rev_8_21_14_0_10_30_48]